MTLKQIKGLYLPFQLLLIGSFLYRIRYQHVIGENVSPRLISYVGQAGILIFAYCMALLYKGPKVPQTLITTGLFRYTRHPMYTGIFLDGVNRWWPVNAHLNLSYFLSLAAFLTSLLVAGYLQEKEVLLRFGDEARQYYARTPRLFIFYPLVWWRHRHSISSPV